MDETKDERNKTIFLVILFGWLIYMIITAFTFEKKPIKKESREAHPIAYMVDGDSVRVYFVWQDSVVNKVYSADTSVMYHKDNKPDFKTNVNIILK
jgi:hypothetical protein